MPKVTATRFVGLDVHKRQITACFVDAEGHQLQTRTFVLTRTRLTHFARHVLRPADHVALEATTNCWAVAAVLKQHVARVVVSNPLVTKAIAQAKVKTDKVDARVLAQLLRYDFLPEVWHPDTTTQQMRLHPGPLGHFFRRLKQRKNHNVAIVATARKRAMIAWHMLRTNEPESPVHA